MRKIALLMLLLMVGCVAPEKLSVPTGGSASTRPTAVPIQAPPIVVRVPTLAGSRSAPTPLPVPPVGTGSLPDVIAQAVAVAKTWLGTPYLWGGCSKSGVDCSCFVRNVLATIGINAPRVTWQQIQWATPVSAAAAQPLDLVFFDNTCVACGPNPTHVGLYLGGGLMIDAGDPVRVEPVYSGHNARYGRPPGL